MKAINKEKKETLDSINDFHNKELFGKKVEEFDEYSLKQLYDFFKEKTPYLDNFSFDEVKDIQITEYLSVCILTNDERLFIDGEIKYSDIVEMGNLFRIGFYLVHSNNSISFHIQYGDDNVRAFIDENYQFKKILITPIRIVCLTNDNNLKVFGFYGYAFIDKDYITNIENIGYLPYNNEPIILKNGQPKFLFKILEYAMEEDEIVWVDKYYKIK